jgi:hypothetical protein
MGVGVGLVVRDIDIESIPENVGRRVGEISVVDGRV